MANSTITNSINRVISVSSNPFAAVSHTLADQVTLRLVAHVTTRVAYRGVRGRLITVSSTEELFPTRVARFPATPRLFRPREVRRTVSDALGLDIDDDASVNNLAWEIFNCFYRTRLLNLNAEFEVVHTTVVMGREEDEEEDEELREAMEELNVECRGGRELGVCAICLDDFCDDDQREEKLIETPCSHVYHKSCIASWLEKKKNSCPICRTRIFC